MLDLRHLAGRHVRPGWVRTIHSAQGATAERVIAHLEAFRANLTDALGIRDGAQIGAIEGHDAGIGLG